MSLYLSTVSTTLRLTLKTPSVAGSPFADESNIAVSCANPVVMVCVASSTSKISPTDDSIGLIPSDVNVITPSPSNAT